MTTYEAAMKSSKLFPYWKGDYLCRAYDHHFTDLIFSSPAPVPFLTEFASTPDVRNGKDCTVHLQKGEDDWIKEWICRYGKSTITCVQQRRTVVKYSLI